MMDNEAADRRNLIHAEVIPPGSLDATRMEFDRSHTVNQAAAQAAERLEYRATAPGFQNDQRVLLPGSETLEQAGVNDGYVLFLVDTAGGQR
jgi:hypothetical protein